MTYTAEQLILAHQTNLKKLETLANQGYAGLAKLVELNVATARAVFVDSFSHAQSLVGARHPQQIVALQLGLLQPLTEKSAAYGRQVATLAAETRSEFSQVVEDQLADAQSAWAELAENLMQNGPAGSGAAVATVRGAVNASQNVIKLAQRFAGPAVVMAQSNFAAASNQAVNAAAAVSVQR